MIPTYGTSGNDTLLGYWYEENYIVGYAGNDTLVGYTMNDILDGGTGNDVLYGQGGNDILFGGTGVDTMTGGIGDDTYYVDTYNDTIIENAGEGTDLVIATVGYQVTLPNNVENLLLDDSGLDIAGYGNDSNNILQGNSSSNSIYGRAGDDNIFGMGNDSIYVEHLWGEDGNDTIYGGNGSSTFNSGNDDIHGGNGDDVLYGESGNDTIAGDAGSDYLDGGAGNDALYGGAGNDIFIVDSFSDVVYEGGNEGIDAIGSMANNYTLGANCYVESLTLLDGYGAVTGIGNNLDNTIIGNTLANTLQGLDGNDTLIGATGNDNLDGGAGDDVYQFASGDGLDFVTDFAGTDKIAFDATVNRSDIAFFQNGSNLYLDYGATVDTSQLQVVNQATSTIERVEAGGYYLSDSTINQAIQDMAAYATANGISFTSVEDVKANADLMNIISNSWQAA